MAYDSKEISDLKYLYVECLRELHSAETQILWWFPKLIDYAASEELKQLLVEQSRQVEEQLRRLIWIFDEIGTTSRGWHSNGVQGLLEDAQAFVLFIKDPLVQDAALVASIRKLHQFRLSAYSSARSFARTLECWEHAARLKQTLNEAQQMDERLAELAERAINLRALSARIGYML